MERVDPVNAFRRGVREPDASSDRRDSLERPGMISRQWRGLARSDQASSYEEHLRAETFPALRNIEGFVDAAILRRRVPNGIEFLIVTRWESMTAIEKFELVE